MSWQGVNDLSAHPAATGPIRMLCHPNSIVLNTLGDLTNRENRFAYPRFANDFQTTWPVPPPGRPRRRPQRRQRARLLPDALSGYAPAYLNGNRHQPARLRAAVTAGNWLPGFRASGLPLRLPGCLLADPRS